MKIIDITPTLSEDMGVWPGLPPYKRTVTTDVAKGDPVGLSELSTPLHIGAHADGPNHYAAEAEGIDTRSLHYYYGPCQVITAQTPAGERVKLEQLKTQEIEAPRVIFKTSSVPNQEKWNNDFCALEPELIQYLAEQHVLLVGIDTPSIDAMECKTMDSHKVIHQNNMAILEGVDLTGVEDGLYTLIALPLKLKGADASPVRAVLLPSS